MTKALIIGSDHAGFELKEYLKKELQAQGFTIEDVGCYSSERCDYPDFASQLASQVQSGKFEYGILCCGSGIGMAMAANRFSGVRAVVCNEMYSTQMSRRHNNANVICFGGRVVAQSYALEMVSAFLSTSFEGARHTDRVKKMDAILHNQECV